MSECVAGPAERTIGWLLDDIAGALAGRGGDDASTDARDIVAALYDAPRHWPSTHRDDVVDDAIVAKARHAVAQRRRGAPLAYAVGRASFRHLTLAVDERVLIPRPETEQLVDLVLGETRREHGGVAIDVGTGSGAIALSLATEGSFAEVVATDVSLDALAVAMQNIESARPALRAPVHVVHGSLLRPVRHRKARVIVSNPPYIAFGEAGSLPASVRDWEPAAALFSGADGLAATATLVRDAADVLEDGGLLAIEVDTRRASLVAELAAREGRFGMVSVRLDLTGRERFVLARRTEKRGADDRG